MVVYHLGADDSKVLPMRMGSKGVFGPAPTGRASHFVSANLNCLAYKWPRARRHLAISSVFGETAATSKFFGFLFLFLSRCILFLCSRTTTLLWGEVIFCGLCELVDFGGGPLSCCTCNTLVKTIEGKMNGDTNLEFCLHSLIRIY